MSDTQAGHVRPKAAGLRRLSDLVTKSSAKGAKQRERDLVDTGPCRGRQRQPQRYDGLTRWMR